MPKGASGISVAIRLVAILRSRRRVSVRRLQEELGISQSAVYRLVGEARCHLPVRLEGGVVVCADGLLDGAPQVVSQ